MGPIGMQELILIFIVALLVFGPRKLPELGKSLGRGLAEFRRASNELRNTIEDEVRTLDDEAKRPAPHDRQEIHSFDSDAAREDGTTSRPDSKTSELNVDVH